VIENIIVSTNGINYPIEDGFEVLKSSLSIEDILTPEATSDYESKAKEVIKRNIEAEIKKKKENEEKTQEINAKNSKLNGQSDEKVGAASDGTAQIIFGVILIAVGFLIYVNGEQLGLTLLGGKDQIMRDMMNGAMFDKGYRNRASSIGNFLQGLYIVVIAVGSIMVLLGLVKSKK